MRRKAKRRPYGAAPGKPPPFFVVENGEKWGELAQEPEVPAEETPGWGPPRAPGHPLNARAAGRGCGDAGRPPSRGGSRRASLQTLCKPPQMKPGCRRGPRERSEPRTATRAPTRGSGRGRMRNVFISHCTEEQSQAAALLLNLDALFMRRHYKYLLAYSGCAVLPGAFLTLKK